MKSLVFVGYFKELFQSIKNQNEYYKVIIIEKSLRLSSDILKDSFDEIIYVRNSLNKQEMESVIEEVQQKYPVKAIYAVNEWVVEVCGYLRDKYKIDGVSEKVAKATRDKFLMKSIISSYGIKTADVEKVDSKNSIINFANKYGFPIVIKPQSGAATQNTFVMKDLRDIDRILQRININRTKYIVESFINGKEYHCDSIVSDGQIIFSSVGKYLSNCIKTVLENEPVSSVIFPSDEDDNEIINKIKHVNNECIKAFNINSSICHLEVFITEKNEVIFGELATRIGGGPLIGKTLRYGYGIDIYDEFVKMGIEKLTDLNWHANKFVGFIALPTQKGKIINISEPSDFSNIEGIKEITILNKIGDIVGENHNTTMRTGYIIAEDSNYDKLKDKLVQIYKCFKLVVEKPKSSLSKIY